MSKFTIEWSKTYISTGTFVIDADNASDAESSGYELIGDQSGSLKYLASEDSVHVYPLRVNHK